MTRCFRSSPRSACAIRGAAARTSSKAPAPTVIVTPENKTEVVNSLTEGSHDTHFLGYFCWPS